MAPKPVATAAPNQANLVQINKARGGDLGIGAGHLTQSPAAGAPPAAPAAPDYATLYEQSLAASRANIAHQIGSALAAVNAQTAGARQATGLLPGALNTIYSTGAAGLHSDAASLDAAQKASGLRSYMGADAQLAPISSAMTADLAARQSDVPLLNIGIAQQAAAQNAAIQQARLSSYADLEQQQRQFLMAQQQQRAQFAHEDSSQKRSADLSLRNTLATAGTKANPLVAQQQRSQQTALDKAHVTTFTADQIPVIRQSPQYAFLASIHDPTQLANALADMQRVGHGSVVDLWNLDNGTFTAASK